MGIGVGGVAAARSWEICIDGLRSVLPRTERRAVALSASIDRVLIAASARASDQLRITWPGLSAATLSPLANAIPLLLGGLTLAAVLATPSNVVLSVVVVLPIAFRIFVAVQETTAAQDRPSHRSFPTTPDEDLPLYSVIVPLRGEARVVDQLLSGIERLDYPPEKLDVIVAVEADDDDTRAAITARKHGIPITVIPVPLIGPQTKPKALNVALPFARGVFTVIYDAEDRPEQNQLRLALQAFRSAGNDLACVQARL